MSILRKLFILGSSFALIGSFLPWRRQGDFISDWILGIRIYPYLQDNGGLLIVLLTLAIIVLTVRPVDFIAKPVVWSIVFSFVLVLVSILHLGSLFLDQAKWSGFVGAPVIQIGLIMVLIGSILLLFTTLVSYFNLNNLCWR